ncbi:MULTISPECIES: TolC family protein [unclassified Pseudomonas]|uniref:TolC family protein n=1 Tax=unclassified Pseudomonas TaxID=196821 RepID=UPI001F5ACAA9|nr:MULTISPECIES: TolC family protein [unclassified Pseudomonas]
MQAKQIQPATPIQQETHSDKPMQPQNGVSALEYFNLSTHRTHAGVTPITGPSEHELRLIFLRAVEIALARSPEVLRFQAERDAAGSDVDEAKGQRWPQIDIGTQSSGIAFGGGTKNTRDGAGINVAISTILFDWGRIDKTINSRERLSDAADDSLAAQIEETSFEVVSTLIELGKQRLIGERSQRFADRMNELVKMLAGIVAVDKGRSSELTQAKARLLQAQALTDAAKAKAREAEITLLKLVGEKQTPIPSGSEWNIKNVNLHQLIDAAHSHPALRKANAEADAADLRAEAIRASSLPQLNWVVGKNTAEDALGSQQAWQTSLNMSWAAFRGGSTRASERAALSRASAGRQEAAQQIRDLEFRIRTAENDARTQLERAQLYKELSVESDRIRDAFYQQWYHLGRRSLLDVLTAESDHYGNQISEINNRFDGYQSIIRQYASAGTLTGWLRAAQITGF